MTDDVTNNVKSKTTWTRLIYLILYGIIYRVAGIVLFAITIIQFVKALLTGSPFKQLQSFGSALAEYNRELVAFLTYHSDEKPFPIGPWPPETPPETKDEKGDDVIIVAEEPSAPSKTTAEAPKTSKSPKKSKPDESGDDKGTDKA